MDQKTKLRFSALFISGAIIFLTLSYSIVTEDSLSLSFLISMILVAVVVAIFISNTKNSSIINFFVNTLELLVFKKAGALDETVVRRQKEDEAIDQHIKSNPILHFFVILLIVVLSGTFICAFIWQFLRLIN